MFKSEKKLLFIAASVILLKILLAFIFPLTGDEAYFITTCKHLDFGYYEHPPMVWWLAYLFSFFGRKTLPVICYRIVPVFSTLLIGLFIYMLLRKQDKEKACLASSLFLLSPVSILSILLTNDVPLFFFLFLSGVFFFNGTKSGLKRDFVVSGVFFGLAFLSKYFAVLFLLPVFVFIVFMPGKNLKLRNLFLFLLGASPFVFINVYWNYTHCWTNVLFNLVYRNKDVSFGFSNFFKFLLFQIYLLMPWVLYFVLRNRSRYSEGFMRNLTFFSVSFLMPVSVLAVLSFFKSVGLHWSIAFYPFIFIWLAGMENRDITRCVKYSVYFALFHFIVISSVIFWPKAAFKTNPKYSDLIMFTAPGEVSGKVMESLDGYLPATPGYTESAVMSYYCRKHFFIFGSFSKSGREDDFITDFKEFDGKNLLIFCIEKPDETYYKNFFETVDVEDFEVKGALFYLVLGRNFRFENYKNAVLKTVLDKFYTVPSFLPCKGCFFKEKYFCN